MAPENRESQPERSVVETDREARARREAANGLRQTDAVFATIERYLSSGDPFRLRSSFISEMNRLSVEGLTDFAGVPRPHGMTIYGSSHTPPDASDVQAHLEDLCDYVNGNWDKPALHLAAYIMWRINWIHPYDDGNGRTSRAVAYVVLSLRLGVRLPGRSTVVDQIVNAKGSYYKALEDADRHAVDGVLDVSALETLLSRLLANQFAQIHAEASGR